MRSLCAPEGGEWTKGIAYAVFKLRGVSRKDGIRNIKRKFPIYKNSNAFTDSSWLKENKENDIWDAQVT